MRRSLRVFVGSVLVFCAGIASTFGGKPAGNSASADLYLAPTSPPCAGLTEVTGVYQDGKGTYMPADSVAWGGTDLRITPLCPNRNFNILLPAAALSVLGGPFETCRGVGALLKIPGLLNAQTGVVGQPSLPPDYPKAASVYYYFFVDSNHDGKFSSRNDTGYNFVWQSGIYLTRTEYSDRTVYDLTTDLTSPDAELIQGVGNGGTSKGTFCVPLKLMVTNMK